MARKTSTGKDPSPHSFNKERPAETNTGLLHASHFHKELDELIRLVEQFPTSDPSLSDGILSISSKFKERTQAEFTSPVRDRRDFKARLAQLVCAQKQARFDSNMRVAAENLLVYLKTAESEDAHEYWRARTLIYELNDIFHLDTSINREAERWGRKVQNELRELSADWEHKEPITHGERQLIREKVRYCACRGNELKRSGKVEEAQRLFEWLFDFTRSKLKQEVVFPCFGILASLTYHLGSVYRILEQHNLAEDMYTQTLDLLYARAKRRSEGDPDDHLFTMRKQAMVIGVGFGWVNLTRGALRRAENALATARSLLARSSDPVVPSYIEMLYGIIKRCRAGTDPGKLQNAIEILISARDKFETSHHWRYAARASWELCLAYTLIGDYTSARKHLDVVAKHAEQTGHPKWQTNVHIGRSRISRGAGDFQSALKEAELAIDWAGDCKSVLPKVDAYITLGEARLIAAENSNQQDITYQSARAAFEEALLIALESSRAERTKDLPSNPKIVAVCNLRIAQCHAREVDEIKANDYFAEWDRLRSNVEHEWVRELAEQVKKEIDSLRSNFIILANDHGEWNYPENVANLRRWLLQQALLHTGKNYSEAATLIGVKRATLYQWQGDARARSKRARINGVGDSLRNKVIKD